MGTAEKVSKVRDSEVKGQGQGHGDAKCTFPAERCRYPCGGGISIDFVASTLTCLACMLTLATFSSPIVCLPAFDVQRAFSPATCQYILCIGECVLK